MTFKKAFIAGLLGCTMLAGCNNSDDKKLTTPGTPQGTFAGEIGQLKGQVDQLQQSTTNQAQADQATEALDVEPQQVVALGPRIDKLEEAVGLRVDIPGLTRFVNTFIGTEMTESGGGHSGNNNPGAQTPFGMVSFGPDNAGTGMYGRGVNGYAYQEKDIQFFTMTHLNGPGCRGQGAVPIMPRLNLDEKAQKFKLVNGAHDMSAEMASPGYYKVTTTDEITSELTATTRTGMARFTYPENKVASLIIDARKSNSLKVLDATQTVTDTSAALDIANSTVSGQVKLGRFCDTTPWVQPIFFFAQFDQPLKAESTVVAGAKAKLLFDFKGTNRTVQMKVGISSVSIANAKENLEHENPGWSFDDTRNKTSENWNTRLNTIQLDLAKPGAIDAIPDADKKKKAGQSLTQFYSALYRVMGGPTVYSDVNGQYRSMGQDKNKLSQSTSELPVRKVEKVSDYKFQVDGKEASYRTHYSGFSMWDTYRSQAQLVAFLYPDEASDMMQSLVADAMQCGAFPHWVDGSEDTIPMEGDHATNVIAGSYAFGARKFDLKTARKFMMQSVTDLNSKCNNNPSARGLDFKTYQEKGYLPSGDHPPSQLIEAITTDRSVGAFLSSLAATAKEDQGLIATLYKRAKNWVNIFDDKAKALTGKSFHESTEENYIWAFAHDWTALIGKLGGKAAAITRLDKLFSIPQSTPFTGTGKEPTGEDLNGHGPGDNNAEKSVRFYIGNEPAFQTPWAYNWVGSPQRAQYILPIIMNKNFSLNPGGLPGNDDLGAMSTWYVWAALGLYPVIPSEGGLAVSTPQFDGMTLWLGNGKKLRLETDKQALLDNVRYISEMKLDGATYQGSWLPLDKIRNGGTLKYSLSATPTDWGAGDDLTPPSGPGADYSKPTAKPLSGLQLIQ